MKSALRGQSSGNRSFTPVGTEVPIQSLLLRVDEMIQ
jgi:hypothetical protein